MDELEVHEEFDFLFQNTDLADAFEEHFEEIVIPDEDEDLGLEEEDDEEELTSIQVEDTARNACHQGFPVTTCLQAPKEVCNLNILAFSFVSNTRIITSTGQSCWTSFARVPQTRSLQRPSLNPASPVASLPSDSRCSSASLCAPNVPESSLIFAIRLPRWRLV